MPANLRALVEKHLGTTLEGAWSMEVDLIGPGGAQQLGLKAQVLYDRAEETPTTGQPVFVNEPVVVLRYSSLSPAPQKGEKWLVRMPVSPQVGAAKESFVLDDTRAIGGGRSIGYIKLYPRRIIQR